MATGRFLGRVSSGVGTVEELDPAGARVLLSVYSAAQVDALVAPLATTAYVNAQIAGLINGATSALDTFLEVQTALGPWAADASGHWLPATDNTYDIGTSVANRPRHVWAGGDLTAGSLRAVGILNVGFLQGVSNGVATLWNTTGSGWTRLNFGGTTSSFPSLAVSGNALASQLADGSDLCGFSGAALITSGGGVASNALSRGVGLRLGSTNAVTWSSTTAYSGTADLTLYRDAADTLALWRSTNAQTFRVYGTRTDASNGDWLSMTKVAGGAATIATVANGTGTAGNLNFTADAKTLTLNATSGQLDVPGNVAGVFFIPGATADVVFGGSGGRGRIRSPANDTIQLRNNADTTDALLKALTLTLSNVPTSASGLTTGQLYQDGAGGALKLAA